ncbi:sensor histidine kinase [Paenibacillus albus]|uniref:histidine kinase n=1 Tax=Paenibacillus albus TaxID=2495582 RepID=A0A3S8ZZV5_9BACL|nr:sensor histidine kinase [Paenibacillus albus]AZN39039.1 HAMP domain-containing histidine kinase [Paenibacillus albus]
MFWIRLLGRTLNSERKALTFYLINTVALIFIYNLLLTSVSISYPFCISITILFIFFVQRAFALLRFEETLQDAKFGIEVGDESDADSKKEQRVLGTIDEIHSSYRDKLTEMNDKLDGRNALFSRFIHNMKTSVAVIELASEKQSADVLADIAAENEKLKANLEQSLNLLRLDEFSNDYVPESLDLYALVKAVINEKRREFIYAGIYPKLNGEAVYVYTDRKWCAYMLDQIITNAIKYSERGKNVYFDITTGMEGIDASLRVRDEGEGIAPEDMPRVFELFFTGRNGRANSNATGIGLAMVKHIAKRLGHEVSLTSTVGEGTSVTIAFLTKMQAYRKSNPFL